MKALPAKTPGPILTGAQLLSQLRTQLGPTVEEEEGRARWAEHTEQSTKEESSAQEGPNGFIW